MCQFWNEKKKKKIQTYTKGNYYYRTVDGANTPCTIRLAQQSFYNAFSYTQPRLSNYFIYVMLHNFISNINFVTLIYSHFIYKS